MKTFKISINCNDLEIVKQVASDRLVTRGLTESEAAELSIFLKLDSSFRKDSYKITGSYEKIEITADSIINAFGGIGSFLHNSRFKDGEIIPSEKRGTTTPDCEFRGIYLSYHFNNFFHAAPLEEIETYIEDMALMGFNTLEMISPSINLKRSDVEGVKYHNDRICKMLALGKKFGMKVLTTISTSCTYEDYPQEWKNTPHAANCNSGNVICISKPGAQELIDEENREYLQYIKDSGVILDYALTFPYDEGGCSCEECKPWGRNGYIRAAKSAKKVLKEVFPDSKFICATWTFDYNPEYANDPQKSEWVGLAESLKDDKWCDIIMADAHEEYPRFPLEHGVPGDLPIIAFPEISMWGLYPWGGYGATTLPKRLTKVWRETQGILMGELLYSEGIFEDINKYVIAGLCEDYNRNPDDTLRNYGGYELGCPDTEKFVDLINKIEYNHWLSSELPDIKHLPEDIIVARKAFEAKTGIKAKGSVSDVDVAKEALELAYEIEKELPDWSRNSWRWRIIYIRTLLDYYRYSGTNINTNEETLAAMHELIDIFHCLKTDDGSVKYHERVRPPCPNY